MVGTKGPMLVVVLVYKSLTDYCTINKNILMLQFIVKVCLKLFSVKVINC